jgi:hypothetical protein
MNDRILEAFLQRQFEEGMALANASDLLRLAPLDGPVPQHYVAEFLCTGLVMPHTGRVDEANLFHVGIYFPPDYLRRANPAQVLTWLGPPTIFHPNVRCYDRSTGIGAICVGRLTPGLRLVDLLYQCFEVITYNKVTMREDDALNHAACIWARQNKSRFPIDRRPLKRGYRDPQIERVV